MMTCEVHKIQLKKARVRVVYGLPLEAVDPKARKARTQFPNANSYAGGGCIVSREAPRTEEVLYCPECRIAEKKWRTSIW
ncbi:MAG: hypothetical protein WBN92_16880 [Terriglobia bacterium]